MAKDSLDKETGDLLQKKIGRPAENIDFGPASSSDRQKKFRKGKLTVQVTLSEKEANKLSKYCLRYHVTRCDLVREMIKKLRMTIPPDFN